MCDNIYFKTIFYSEPDGDKTQNGIECFLNTKNKIFIQCGDLDDQYGHFQGFVDLNIETAKAFLKVLRAAIKEAERNCDE